MEAGVERWDVLFERGGEDEQEGKEGGEGVGWAPGGQVDRSTARSDFKHARGSLQERSNSGRQSSSCASAFKSVPASAAAAEEGTTCCRWLFFLNRVLCPAGRALSTRTGRRWITHFSRFRHCAAFQSGAQRSGVGPGALRLLAPSEDSRIFSVCVQSTNNAQRDPLSFKIDTLEHKHTHPVFFPSDWIWIKSSFFVRSCVDGGYLLALWLGSSPSPVGFTVGISSLFSPSHLSSCPACYVARSGVIRDHHARSYEIHRL